MKLYYSPGACSLGPHIVLNELGLPYDPVKVDLRSKQSSEGDYRQVNPKGSVPALTLDNGEVLTEAGVILQYLADLKPEAGLIGKAGSLERYRHLEWLNYISTELHKRFSILFTAQFMMSEEKTQEELRVSVRKALGEKFDYLEGRIGDAYLTGSDFNVADAYLFVVLRWSPFMGLDLSRWPKLNAYVSRVRERPSVKAAMSQEDLKA